jgi:hypothetical protein
MLPAELIRSTRQRLGLSQRRLALSWNRMAARLADAGRAARGDG